MENMEPTSPAKSSENTPYFEYVRKYCFVYKTHLWEKNWLWLWKQEINNGVQLILAVSRSELHFNFSSMLGYGCEIDVFWKKSESPY